MSWNTLIAVGAGALALGGVAITTVDADKPIHVVVHASPESKAKHRAFLGISDDERTEHIKTAVTFTLLNKAGRRNGKDVSGDDAKVAEFMAEHGITKAEVEAGIERYYSK